MAACDSTRWMVVIMWRSFLVWTFLCVTHALTNIPTQLAPKVFIDQQYNGIFNHLVIDKNTGNLYIAGVNKIFQLSPDLFVDQSLQTGPKKDNPDCYPNVECRMRKLMDTYNKVLLIDYKAQKLIACINLFHGRCMKYKLTELTKQEALVDVPVVANDEVSTSFAFIAPGPAISEGPQPNVMYTGVTYTNNGIQGFRDLIPAFCSRNIDTFAIYYKDFKDSTRIEIETQHRTSFRVNYVYGFSSNNFSYMLTVQRKSTQSDEYISKIIRVCQNDKLYHSYVEIPLKCRINGNDYNLIQAATIHSAGAALANMLKINLNEDVLYAIFSVGRNFDKADNNEPVATNQSAFCVYPLPLIRERFTRNIKNCFEGISNLGPDHVTVSKKCKKSNFTNSIDDNYCGKININYPIGGDSPVEMKPALTFQDREPVSAIAVSTTHDYTVAFVGLRNGHLKKISIQSSRLANDYADMTIDSGSPINADLKFDLDRKHIYVMTEHKLTKLPVQNCDQYTTCTECLGAQDPYCGWCSLEKKCTVRAECKEAEIDLRWLPYSGKQCTTITSIQPKRVQIKMGKTTTLSLMIQNFPPKEATYHCAFVNQDSNELLARTLATRTEQGIQCETPLPRIILPFPAGSDHITTKLSVQMGGNNFVSTNFTFFDCSLQKSCTSCTLSKFPCTWCIGSHECQRLSTDCPNVHIVTSKGDSSAIDRVGPAGCPRIEHGFREILYSSGTTQTVRIRAVNLTNFQSNLKCFFNMRKGVHVSAHLRADKMIECDPIDFWYVNSKADKDVPFQITWGNGYVLDNPQNIKVRMYKCEMLASNCGKCLTRHKKYKCVWCQLSTVSDSKCSIQTQCYGTPLNRTQHCPYPRILSFSPMTGSVDGGTNITIKGENLGKTVADLIIRIGGVSCVPFLKGYRSSSKVICKTGRQAVAQSSHIHIRVASKYVARSRHQFNYVKPVVRRITPNKGPRAGGTFVTIEGEYVNIGSRRSVEVAGYPCIAYNASVNQIVCQTSMCMSDMSRIGYVTIHFDGITKNYSGESVQFEYVENPTVSKLNDSDIKSILSGGIPVRVEGTNFRIIREPKLIFWHEGMSYFGACNHKGPNQELLECFTPNMISALHDAILPIDISYGYLMDNVSLTNMTPSTHQTFRIHPDPVFKPFAGGVKQYKKENDLLFLEAENLFPVMKDKYRVYVGAEPCNITTVFSKSIECKPPQLFGEELDDPQVTVQIGSRMYTPGYIDYVEYFDHSMVADDEDFPRAAKIGVGAGAFVVVLVVVFFIILHRKSKQSTNLTKKYQNQMDQLSMKVAKECKEAFAELQTDMLTELTSDLSGQVAVPYWDYRTYCMHVLFPAVNTHPVMSDFEVDITRRDSLDKGLKLFSNLLTNKTFMLIFIRTLESNKKFTMQNLVNFASMISVVLQPQMEYATDILKTLLQELIEKSVEKNQAKLLLRRTQSVAEKMLTNWFTFLLYKFLTECAGEPLFMLFQAVKQQTAKGPVDILTSEARYALSEDKLIRQQIDFKQMTLNVLDIDAQYGQQEHAVKVLDCDTISQVKEKILDAIYRNAPFSCRPPKEDLDLEWNRGTQGRLILQDDDNTSRIEADYKRTNSLAHYKVPDGAYVALIARQPSLYNLSLISDKSSHKYDNINTFNSRSPSLGRAVTPQAVYMDVENNSKCYHLVKSHDAESHKEGDRGSKMVSEVYLTRLLKTKGTLQQFVDDLFERVFSTAHRGSALPLAIKYMFDFLDDQALHYSIQDPEVVHTWKSNSLPLRFWVNVIKNPHFVFDIHKSNIVDSCLSVVAQTFMDSCSMREHQLGINSPSSKLLYAQEIPKYQKWVERYYSDIKMMPAISDQDMNAMLADESRAHQYDFNTKAALLELYQYVRQYFNELVLALEEDEFARKNKLNFKLDQVQAAMEGHISYC